MQGCDFELLSFLFVMLFCNFNFIFEESKYTNEKEVDFQYYLSWKISYFMYYIALTKTYNFPIN